MSDKTNSTNNLNPSSDETKPSVTKSEWVRAAAIKGDKNEHGALTRKKPTACDDNAEKEKSPKVDKEPPEKKALKTTTSHDADEGKKTKNTSRRAKSPDVDKEPLEKKALKTTTSPNADEGKKTKNTSRRAKSPDVDKEPLEKKALKTTTSPDADEGKKTKTTSKRAKSPDVDNKEPSEKEALKTKKSPHHADEGKKAKNISRTEKSHESTEKEELKTKRVPHADEGRVAKTSSKAEKVPRAVEGKVPKGGNTTPDILVVFVRDFLHLPLSESVDNQFGLFRLKDAAFKTAYKSLTMDERAMVRCEEILRTLGQDSVVCMNFEAHCKKAYCHNEFLCFKLLTNMLDKETDDYDKFVTSFNEAWEKYFNPRIGEQVNSYVLKEIAALHKIIWDDKNKMATPLSGDIITAATSIVKDAGSMKRANANL